VSEITVFGKIIDVLQTILFLCLVALLVFIAIAQVKRMTPAFDFVEVKPITKQAEFCPGDILEWRTIVSINQAPVMVLSVETVWSIDNANTAIIDNDISALIWTETGYSTRTIKFIIPDLPPGRYESRRAAQDFASAVDTYSVPFKISADCP
jgi:hypothetical protein